MFDPNRNLSQWLKGAKSTIPCTVVDEDDVVDAAALPKSAPG